MAISAAFSNLVSRLSLASQTDSPALLIGETGTGKRQAAMSMHRASPRRSSRFITINCIGISDERFELELCGSQTSEFEMNRKGALFLAEGGTLYLHEVTELSRQSQSLLLRCIESGVYTPIGGNDPIRSDVRVVASSSANVQASVDAGKFRTDLYHFLSSMIVNTPSLNDRKDDLPRLVALMLDDLVPNNQYSLSDEALEMLSYHSFSGNLVELKNILHRAVVQGSANNKDAIISCDSIQKAITTSVTISSSDAAVIERKLQSDYISATAPELAQSSGQTVSYGLKRPGRWESVEVTESNFSSENLRRLDEPASISEFHNEGLDQGEVASIGATEEPSKRSRSSAFMSLKEQERQYFVDLMAKCNGDKHAAAKIAGVTLRTLYRKLEEV